jgi:hypothetical protein
MPLDLVDRENLVARVSDAQLALRTKGVEAGHVISFTQRLEVKSVFRTG